MGFLKIFINAIIKKLEISDTSDTSLEKIFNYTNEIITNIGTSNISFESIKSNDGTIKDYFLIPEKSSSLQSFV